jgi:thiol-disulfide isomerase/thioredoxin
MIRTFWATLAMALFATVAYTADPPKPIGNWKYRFQEDQQVTFLLAFSNDDGKWVGDFIGSNPQLKTEPKLTDLKVNADRVAFTIELGGREAFSFEGILAADGKKIVGSMSKFGSALGTAELYPSKLKKLTDTVDLAREDFGQLDAGQSLFDAGFLVAANANAKLKVDDARAIADKLTKAATSYGPRMERAVAVRLATTFAEQAGFEEVALAQAQRAERMLTDDTPIAAQIEVTEVIVKALSKAGKAAEAKKYTTALAKLEVRDSADYAKSTLTFETPEFKGRKAKSDRVVVVEVFTGVECPPCVAVDVAFDALLKTYQSKDVVFIKYHIHVPSPDPLTAPEGMARGVGLFGERLSAPAVLVNGVSVGRGGGPLSASKAKYQELLENINAQLEKPSGAKLTVILDKDDKGTKATAKVTDLEKPSDKISLRFAVVEDRVRYFGGNGARFHNRVLRAMPGGIKGFPLSKKETEQSISVNTDELRQGLNKYLDEFAKEQGEFSRPARPLALTNLKLIAFVQNDETKEILNAVQIDLDAK